MLSYLAASLSQDVSPGARLLALQSVLRATAAGYAWMRPGLVRGMRIQRAQAAWEELVNARWITSPPDHAAPYAGWLTDPVVGIPGRSRRSGAADWALRAARQGRVRGLGPAGQLLTLALRGFTQEPSRTGSADSRQLGRMCGLPTTVLLSELDHLASVGIVSSWSLTPTGDEAGWQLA
ncbi:hypothetical protein ACWGN5_17470 [Streptomyces sp. NPDC055815]